MSHIRVLLIDLDGVLRRWEPANARRAELAGGLPDGAIVRAAFDSELLQPAITGHVTDYEWRTWVIVRLGREYPEGDARKAIELWSASAGVVDERVLSLVRHVRSRARVVLVTNATSRLAKDLDQLGLTDAFDLIVNSSDVGTAKPAPAIFEAALKRAGVSAEAATFVDDGAGNVAAAEALGIAGHIYRNVLELRVHLAGCGLLDPTVLQ